ncbi:ABC transporter permease [Streptomyces sp. NPDC059474]|uniref:ABC transporter permease n=1 Tax=unclassified Streptomyces TaxID=2593676 RepID=UPI0033C43563
MALLYSLRVVRYSAQNAVADFAATYTWKSWLFGWLGRMLSQVVFFTLAGRLLGSPSLHRERFLGNSVMTCVVEAMMVVASSAWERRAGTLPLLVSSPAGLFEVFFGRSLQWVVSGIGTSFIALLALGPFFGVHWAPAAVPVVVVVLLVTSLGSYCFGLFLSVLVLQATQLRNIVSNVAYLAMMTFCGVQVPVGYWPAPIGWVAECIPITHGLRAMNALAAGGRADMVRQQVLEAALCGVFWILVANAAFRLLAERGRRDGSIEYSA